MSEATHQPPAEALQEASAPLAASLTPEEAQWRLTERKALALSRAGNAIPKGFQNRPGDILAAWLLGDELGISRMSALRGIFVVNGRPSLSGDLLLAVARGAGVRVIETIDGKDDKMTATCKAILTDGTEITRTFSVEDAKRAGLWGGSDPWKKYPVRMLHMRARGFALRDAIPDKLAGVYSEGELTGDMIDVTPNPVEA